MFQIQYFTFNPSPTLTKVWSLCSLLRSFVPFASSFLKKKIHGSKQLSVSAQWGSRRIGLGHEQVGSQNLRFGSLPFPT